MTEQRLGGLVKRNRLIIATKDLEKHDSTRHEDTWYLNEQEVYLSLRIFIYLCIYFQRRNNLIHENYEMCR